MDRPLPGKSTWNTSSRPWTIVIWLISWRCCVCPTLRFLNRPFVSVIAPRLANQKAGTPPTPAASKPARAERAIQAVEAESDSEPGASGSESEGDTRDVFLAAVPDRRNPEGQPPARQDTPRTSDRADRSAPTIPCSHCGSTKHNDLGCWKRLTCKKCRASVGSLSLRLPRLRRVAQSWQVPDGGLLQHDSSVVQPD
jgi:hypothetical protein